MVPAIRPASPARRYARALGKLRKADIPNDRAVLLEVMAAATDAASAAETRDKVTEDQYAAACLLRQVAASERGWVLIPAEGPGEDYGYWLDLAAEWGHARRATVLAEMQDTLALGPVCRSVLDDVAASEQAVAGQPPARPVMMP